MRPHHNWLELLLVSEACSFVSAIVYVIILTLSLPPTDGAYGQSPFADPLVAPVMSIGAGFAGLLAWPFMCLVLRQRRLRSCVPVILGVTLTSIVTITPFHAGLGILGSFIALGAALLLCRQLVPTTKPLWCCQSCGYNLTGNVSGVCPECGTAVAAREAKAG